MALDVTARVDLTIDGMTCAACANRIQRRIGKLDAVAEAQVNFATGRATVIHDGTVEESTLADEVAALGYNMVVVDADGNPI